MKYNSLLLSYLVINTIEDQHKIWHSGHYRPIALLKRTHRQVKISRTRETGHVKRGKFAQHVTQTSCA